MPQYVGTDRLDAHRRAGVSLHPLVWRLSTYITGQRLHSPGNRPPLERDAHCHGAL